MRTAWPNIALLSLLTVAQCFGASPRLTAVLLPDAGESVLGAAFSPNGNQLVLARQTKLELLDIVGEQPLVRAVVPISPSKRSELLAYSGDGRYIAMASDGSDVLRILDAVTLRLVSSISLYSRSVLFAPGTNDRPFYRGIVSLAASQGGKHRCRFAPRRDGWK